MHDHLQEPKGIHFLGLGFERGQVHRGLCNPPDLGREQVASLNSFGYQIFDHGDIRQSNLEQSSSIVSSSAFANFEWTPYRLGYEKGLKLYRNAGENEQIVFWGGDHSVAIASVAAFCEAYPHGKILWIDAHADINIPEASPTGNVHGMPLAVLLNLKNIATQYFPWIQNHLTPDRIIYLGLRDVDPFEVEMIRTHGITAFSAEDVERRGMNAVAKDILSYTDSFPLHISFDIDCMDPSLAPSTGVPVVRGLQISDLVILGNLVFQHSQITSVDMVEINPSIGSIEDCKRTHETARIFLEAVFS